MYRKAPGFTGDTLQTLTHLLFGLPVLVGGNAWAQCPPLKFAPTEGTPEALFGFRTGIDAGILIAGAHLDDGGGAEDAGAAYVFESMKGKWVQHQKLLADDGADEDFFGASVATLRSSMVLVGAMLDDDRGDRSGSAYFFERKGSEEWLQRQKLVPQDGGRDDFFGTTVAFGGDDLAMIGAELHGFAGAVYIYHQIADQ